MKPGATPPMHVPRWWLRGCAAGMIAAFGVDAHQRTRTYTAMGKQVNETAVTIWLTDRPLDNAALDKETADHFRAVSRQMTQAFVKGVPPVRCIRIELTPAGKVVNFDCAPKGEATGGSITVASSKFDADVQFDAPVAAEK